jgi:hypothetical protein
MSQKNTPSDQTGENTTTRELWAHWSPSKKVLSSFYDKEDVFFPFFQNVEKQKIKVTFLLRRLYNSMLRKDFSFK